MNERVSMKKISFSNKIPKIHFCCCWCQTLSVFLFLCLIMTLYQVFPMGKFQKSLEMLNGEKKFQKILEKSNDEVEESNKKKNVAILNSISSKLLKIHKLQKLNNHLN